MRSTLHLKEWVHHIHLPHEWKPELGKDTWFFLMVLALFAAIMLLGLLLPSTGVEQAPQWSLTYPYFP